LETNLGYTYLCADDVIYRCRVNGSYL